MPKSLLYDMSHPPFIMEKTMKNRSFAFHVFCFLFPALALTGIYGIGILFNSFLHSPSAQSSPDLHNAPTSSFSQKTPIEDLYAQTDIFSDADIQSGITAYASTLPGVSARVGASVVVTHHNDPSPLNSSDPSSQPPAQASARSEFSASCVLAPPPAAHDPSVADIWRIDTIYASRQNPDLAQLRKFVFYQWNGSAWERRDDEAFFESQTPAQPLVFYVHGNRTEVNTAVMQGLSVLRHFETDHPARLVIWRWDASRVAHRPRIEFSTKAHFADYQGFYLAKMLDSLRPDSRVLLSAHSFGARTVLNALHLRAGGSFGGKFLSDAFPGDSYVSELSWNDDSPSAAASERGKGTERGNGSDEVKNRLQDETQMVSSTPLEINVLLVAPAVGCTALGSDGLFPRALESVSALRMTQNTSDPALKFYPLMNGPARRLPEALGYVGPSWADTNSELQKKVSVIRLDYPTHQFIEYMTMRSVQNALHF